MSEYRTLRRAGNGEATRHAACRRIGVARLSVRVDAVTAGPDSATFPRSDDDRFPVHSK